MKTNSTRRTNRAPAKPKKRPDRHRARPKNGTRAPSDEPAPPRAEAPPPADPVASCRFSDFDIGEDILRAVTEAGFETPRPIQAATIPHVLEGRDVLGLAQTGTGKTAAFALPIIERLLCSEGRPPSCLIVAPTRELATQIQEELRLLARHVDLRVATVFGGVPAGPQVRALRRHPDVIVACPGRLLDLCASGDVRLDGIEILVLDEADHMLDMGFLPDIRRILEKLPSKRQNLLFSATMSPEIRTLADRILQSPHVVELAHSAPAHTIKHVLYPVQQKRKTALLYHVMGHDDFESAIIFLRTKHRARRLAQALEREGHRAIALQGNMSQGQRKRAMQGFRDGSYNVLVATDIAARGIDVAQLSHVINFDVPDTPDAYTHRIGRTGRAECRGKAFTFVTSEDTATVRAIERKLDMRIPRVKLRAFGENVGDDDLERRPARNGRGGRNGTAARRSGSSQGRKPAASRAPRKDSDGAPRKATASRTRNGSGSGSSAEGRPAGNGSRRKPQKSRRPARSQAGARGETAASPAGQNRRRRRRRSGGAPRTRAQGA